MYTNPLWVVCKIGLPSHAMLRSVAPEAESTMLETSLLPKRQSGKQEAAREEAQRPKR